MRTQVQKNMIIFPLKMEISRFVSVQSAHSHLVVSNIPTGREYSFYHTPILFSEGFSGIFGDV